MQLRDYWDLFRRGWVVILVSTLACVVVAVAATAFTEPQYESKAKLFVSNVEEDPTRAYRGGLFASLRVTSYADLVGSQALTERVAQELDLQPGDPGLSPDDVTAEVLEGTVIIEITAQATTPERARAVAQAYADQLPRLIDELETTPGSDAAPLKATVINDATTPGDPAASVAARNVALGLALGLLLGAAIVVVRDFLDSTVRTPKQAADLAGAPLLGALPRVKVPATILTAERANTPRAEAFRVLRTNVDSLTDGPATPVYLVSSPTNIASRVSTSVNLALALAEARDGVLLVEGDLRRPQVGGRLGLTEDRGLTSVLTEGADLDVALQRARGGRLSVLTAGPRPDNLVELLGSDAMRDLIDQLRKRFRTVVIDAPPLLPFTDAALLASWTDGALLVVESGTTTAEQIDTAIRRLQTVGARTAGVVLTQVARNQPDFYSGKRALHS